MHERGPDPLRQRSSHGQISADAPNFGLLPELPERIRDKRARYGAYRDRALADLEPIRSLLPQPVAA